MNLLEKYKRWVNTYNYLQGHTNAWDEWCQPHYRWNPFDYRNDDWTPLWLDRYICGWKSVHYAFEAWSYRMTDRRYHSNPEVFWAELNDIWSEMNYSHQFKKTSGENK
jgi:hypothetical protein